MAKPSNPATLDISLPVFIRHFPNLLSSHYTPKKSESPEEQKLYKSMLPSKQGNARPNIFLRAVRDGELDMVLKFLEYSHTPTPINLLDYVDGYQNSALHYACYYGHRNVIQVLLVYGGGTILKSFNHVGNSAMHLAVEAGMLESIECLVMVGGANLINEKNCMGMDCRRLAEILGRREIEDYFRRVEGEFAKHQIC